MYVYQSLKHGMNIRNTGTYFNKRMEKTEHYCLANASRQEAVQEKKLK